MDEELPKEEKPLETTNFQVPNSLKANRKDINIPTTNELTLLISRITNLKHRAMFSFMYLSGRRISEIVGIKNEQKGGDEYKIKPIAKYQLERLNTQNGTPTLRVSNVIILKRREIFKQPVPIPVNKESELLRFIEEYTNTLSLDQSLFAYNRKYVWTLSKQYFGNQYYNHFFRHCKATRLKLDNNFDSEELRQFFGWKDSRMASTYAHLSWENLADKLAK